MRELDKRIADLRGECAHEYVLTRESEFIGEDAHIWTCKHCKDEEYQFDRRPTRPEVATKPYTTDIRYAFELWQEMNAVSKNMGLQKFQRGDVHLGWTCHMKYASVTGKTEAEAIARCYIAWRENEHCKR